MIPTELQKRICELLEETSVQIKQVSGSTFVSLFLVKGKNTQAFMKYEPKESLMLQAEAIGLQFLESYGIRVPHVLGSETGKGGSFLLMEYIQQGSATQKGWNTFVKDLMALHSQDQKDQFGLGEDNFIGSLHQMNTPKANAYDFFLTQRIKPQLELADQKQLMTKKECEHVLAFVAQYQSDLSSVTKASPVHGDLWNGNVIFDSNGQYVLIDPAVHYNHPATDWAMMALFSGFPKSVWDHCPVDQKLIGLYQLYPLLVHVNLFGVSYVAQVNSIIARNTN